jgi:hypothetical protein
LCLLVCVCVFGLIRDLALLCFVFVLVFVFVFVFCFSL